jgi:hypothetical protein
LFGFRGSHRASMAKSQRGFQISNSQIGGTSSTSPIRDELESMAIRVRLA